jgi:hypothetical protein
LSDLKISTHFSSTQTTFHETPSNSEGAVIIMDAGSAGGMLEDAVKPCLIPWASCTNLCHHSRLTSRVENMNRRKKIQQLLKAHAKKASAKLAPANKSKYISKADRLKLAAEPGLDSINSPES